MPARSVLLRVLRAIGKRTNLRLYFLPENKKTMNRQIRLVNGRKRRAERRSERRRLSGMPGAARKKATRIAELPIYIFLFLVKMLLLARQSNSIHVQKHTQPVCPKRAGRQPFRAAR
jgi:hypothetical protein